MAEEEDQEQDARTVDELREITALEGEMAEAMEVGTLKCTSCKRKPIAFRLSLAHEKTKD